MSLASLDLCSEPATRFRTQAIKPRTAQFHGRVLVADDSSDGRRMISGILGCLGLEVSVAENGRAACDAVLKAAKRGEPFDLILMDSDMPVIDGYEATALLRASGCRARIVALVPDNPFLTSGQRSLKAGCDGWASKPITFPMLRDLVRQHLPQKESPQRQVAM